MHCLLLELRYFLDLLVLLQFHFQQFHVRGFFLGLFGTVHAPKDTHFHIPSPVLDFIIIVFLVGGVYLAEGIHLLGIAVVGNLMFEEDLLFFLIEELQGRYLIVRDADVFEETQDNLGFGFVDDAR